MCSDELSQTTRNTNNYECLILILLFPPFCDFSCTKLYDGFTANLVANKQGRSFRYYISLSLVVQVVYWVLIILLLLVHIVYLFLCRSQLQEISSQLPSSM